MNIYEIKVMYPGMYSLNWTIEADDYDFSSGHYIINDKKTNKQFIFPEQYTIMEISKK